MDATGFERLVFSLISSSDSYENAAWLTRTDAADRGRDLSADRVSRDPLSGVTRSRVIVQCKHWLDRSVRLPDVSSLKHQMGLWQSPRVDVLIIATTGRFTTDAIDFIEKHNNSDRAMKVEMWPERVTLNDFWLQDPSLLLSFTCVSRVTPQSPFQERQRYSKGLTDTQAYLVIKRRVPV
jgi:hypothetical protein